MDTGEPMTAPRRRPRPALAFRRLSLALLVLVVAGCAPKRVVRRDAEQPARAMDQRPAQVATASTDTTLPLYQGLDLPPPEPRGPAGTWTPERTPESLTFGAQAAALAAEQLGKPYQWGASGPDRFDCSGLVQHVYGSLGVALPRVSAEQARVGREVRRLSLIHI